VSRRRAALLWVDPVPLPTYICNVARALVPDVVEAQVQRDKGPVAGVQRGQRLSQEPRPMIVYVVVAQGQMGDPGVAGE
jgi:hypothetical protein